MKSVYVFRIIFLFKSRNILITINKNLFVDKAIQHNSHA
ncbi:hypothetical protein BV140_1462 [Haemophilus influenzae]|nr:hypothetical protein BV083_1403 [Haemophilus influenzae]AVI98209.1 hypothetical protein BV085_1400 [Haemophilus influenzae]AVJ09063.1 hypothetical protein BV140_1462 [Haemophilus influenzae]